MAAGPGDGTEETSEAPLSAWTDNDVTRPGSASDASGFTPGTMLAGRFRVVALVGSGGMGEVYRADDVKLGQPVALKFLRGALSPERLQRLYAEARIGRQVSHPNVCRLYDVFEVGGHTFLAMEYVDGEDLASLLARIGRLSPDKALEITRDLCAGLAAAHDRGVVHRDLKPANVMIDGRGRARLTDFGLAVGLETPGAATGAGTPAYMSPEQLAGREVTPRSDLYALGLLLYEVFSGRRFYDARTLQELLLQHGQAKRGRLQSASRLLDPAVERVILQCLEDDAAARPASARALLAMLPGGDPLDAAVAAGETPSPEAVAAAGTAGDLRPVAAWACLLATFLGYALAARLGEQSALIALAPLPKPPDVLVERSREILMRAGQTAMADWAYSFEIDGAYLAHVRAQNPAPARWKELLAAEPGSFTFFYRQGPLRLIAANRDAVVTRADPPLDQPGMAEVLLDARGRLLSFQAVPPQMEEPRDWPEPDWSGLFREAGLDPVALQPMSPRWAAPVDSDRKWAWSGPYPGGAMAVRVEAASYHGRPVWFAVLPPWAEASRAALAAREPASATPFTGAGLIAIALTIPTAGLLLARRNLRLGRGDRNGAFRVAAFVVTCYALARICRADHVSAPVDEVWILIKLLSYPALWATLAWLMYLALEPYARRSWPRVLISWKRLLSGRFADPLVGRDVLFGVTAGAAALVLSRLAAVAAYRQGTPLHPETFGMGPTLTALPQVFFRLFVNQFSAVQYALLFLFLLVLLRLLLRNAPLAMLAWCGLASTPFIGGNPQVEWAFGLVRAALMLLVLVKTGLLTLVVMMFVLFATVEVPLLLDAQAWYAFKGWPVLLCGLGLALYGFHVSLAGKSPFGRAFED
jgi:serine/threonine-protein kinase